MPSSSARADSTLSGTHRNVTGMPPRPHALPTGFIAPCLPTNAPTPSGREWVHEIKFDGFRVIARKSDKRVKLYSRPGNDLTDRFPLIVEALAKLQPSRLPPCLQAGPGGHRVEAAGLVL